MQAFCSRSGISETFFKPQAEAGLLHPLQFIQIKRVQWAPVFELFWLKTMLF